MKKVLRQSKNAPKAAHTENRLMVVCALILLEVVFVRLPSDLLPWLFQHAVPAAVGNIGLFGIYALLTLLTVLGIFRLLLRTPFRQYGIRSVSKPEWKTAIICLGLLFPIAALGRIVDPGFDRLYAFSVGLSTFRGLGFFLLTLPFFLFREELFLRFSQFHLREFIGNYWAIIVLAANFSILHYPFGFSVHAWSVIPSVFLGTAILGVLFVATQNLWLTFAVHLLYDAVLALQIFLHVAGRTIGEWLLWIAYAALFFAVARPGWQLLRTSFQRNANRISPASLVMFGIVALALPLILLFVF